MTRFVYRLGDLLDRAADSDADREALRFADRSLSYAELIRRADRLANVLVDHGVRRGDRVGILLPKALETGVAVYGILRSGACYVPLDPLAPLQRLALTLRDAGVRVVVSGESRRRSLEALVLPASESGLETIVGLESRGDIPPAIAVVTARELAAASEHAPLGPWTQDDLAYLLYTSGSTGRPKGILHSHSSALAFAEVARATYGLGHDDRVSQHAPLHFDLSTLDYFATAAAGGTTVIVSEAHTKLPASLSALMESERLTVLYCVPLALVQLLERGAIEQRDLSSLRWVIFGGEPASVKHIRRLVELWPHARFSNIYGPTEVNGCTCWTLPREIPESTTAFPIGRPLANVETLVVDSEGRELPAGERGELLVRSPTRMRGYWGRADLDRAATVRRVGPGGFEDNFHRTGDAVVRDADGVFWFHGRLDRQVKSRGHRVELDEVESILLSHPAVETAAAFVVPDRAGSQVIHGSAVLRDRAMDIGEAELRAHCLERLPGYAVPERIEILSEFPRTTTGKIDRMALRDAILARQPDRSQEIER
jgi:amino acid adenylation domain-containing protein